MKYYRVLNWCDGNQYYKWDTRKAGYVKPTGLYMITGELLTERERNKFCNHDKHFEVVEIPKNKTHWFFGARFENTKFLKEV